jgi:hypothetical protein
LILSPAQVEELKHAIKKPVNNFQSARFEELATIIHQCLKEQDSDKALKLDYSMSSQFSLFGYAF